MNARIDLPYTRPPISLNDSGSTRGAMFAKAKTIKGIREDIVILAKQAKLPNSVAFAMITLNYRPRDSAPRDSVNLAPTLKALVDGLTPARVVKTKRGWNVHPGYGFITDDSTRHCSTPEPVIWPAEKGMPGAMWLEISWKATQ